MRPLKKTKQREMPLALERHDVTGVRKVRVLVAWSVTPFYWNPKGPPLSKQVAEWGHEIEREVEVPRPPEMAR